MVSILQDELADEARRGAGIEGTVAGGRTTASGALVQLESMKSRLHVEDVVIETSAQLAQTIEDYGI